MSDFYVGYLPKTTRKLAGFIRSIVFMLGLLTVVVAFALIVSQMPFANSAFEFGKVRTFEGFIESVPYPTLLVARPGQIAQGQAREEEKYSRYLLVAPGKHGAEDLVAGLDGKQVSLQGQLIYRGSGTMVEIVPSSVKLQSNSRMYPAAVHDLGAVTVTGEIVDSKCYLGVMNPGQGKVHRDCASLCLRGGIPPIFVSSDGGDQLLLVGLDGGALDRGALREFVAEPLSIEGELFQTGDRRLLRINPQELRHETEAARATSPFK